MELVGVIGGFKKRKSWFVPSAPLVPPPLPPQQPWLKSEPDTEKEAKQIAEPPKKTANVTPAIGPPRAKKQKLQDESRRKDDEEALEQESPARGVADKGKEKDTSKGKETEEAEEEEEEDEEEEKVKESTVFYGEELLDYRGRSYVNPPSHLHKNPLDHRNYLPKNIISTVNAHDGPIPQIRLFPGYGHLLLSAGMDGVVKIWDVGQKGKGGLLRSFHGHQKGVKDVTFLGEEGRTFLSASFDTFVRLWDTETGQCISKFKTPGRALPHCVAAPPNSNQSFLAGYSNSRILQWDIRRPGTRPVQRYAEHMRAVNAVAFVDHGRRFVSTADDQSIRIWDYGTPVNIKCISEPHMHSMPSLALHPDGDWMAVQSQDNQIMLLQTHGKFRINKKKCFRGHNVAGFACHVAFSPTGQYLISGDSGGNLWIWDWKSGNAYQKIKCHQKALSACQWHPLEPSRVITSSWDGTICYLD